MKLFKKTLLVAALSTAAAGAFAMTPMQDESLAQVSGQDGVSMAADLHITIGEFKYADTDANGGSVSFNNIKINGVIAGTLDIINNTTFLAEASALSGPASVLGVTGGTGLAAFQPAGDVVKIAVPEVTTNKALSVTIDSIKMGNSAASYGSFAMNNIQLQGTTAYIWAH